jgi:site-specific DNA-cytosine methylase
VRIVAAIDQSRAALRCYSRNFPDHPAFPLAIESIPAVRWRDWRDDLWWLSPPCPPYTLRGARRDLDDPRSRSFRALVDRLADCRPAALALENVPGFAGSRAHGLLTETLRGAGYDVRETLLCPTELGGSNRRRRFYLVASRTGLRDWPERGGSPRPLSALLDRTPPSGLECDQRLEQRYPTALHIVDVNDPAATTACFTAGYGRSIVRSGSYLRTPTGLRRFSPAEILRQLDFPDDFTLPPDLSLALGWRLAGNGLSVRAVRWVLAAFPGLSIDGSSLGL